MSERLCGKRGWMAKILIAGSRAIPSGVAPRLLVAFLAVLPEDAVVLLRRGTFSPPSRFDGQVESLCHLLGIKVEWRVPERPGPVADLREASRRAVFARDIEAVSEADLVLCFVSSDQQESEDSGTRMLADKAIETNGSTRAVYAYSVGGEPPNLDLCRIGEHDPEGQWSQIVPQA
jgi:hypothetical protein